ncbi:MAG: universal stress protein [Nitrospiraceae bacterium]|nr:universal stress protein [Nitrospiraceae bacterium]
MQYIFPAVAVIGLAIAIAAAFRKAVALGLEFGMDVEAVSVYDPHFHRRAFESLVKVLSDEAQKLFKFKEQEKLHDEIIDDGLGKIYQGALEEARQEGLKSGVEVKTTLLAGKAAHEICEHLKKDPPSLFVAGRFGAHRAEELDIGNTAENLLRTSPVLESLRTAGNALKGKCGACEYRLLCGGCRARAYALRGDYLDEDPWCAYGTRCRRGDKTSSARGGCRSGDGCAPPMEPAGQ